jgi:predicted protein tyrosine phosphatase
LIVVADLPDARSGGDTPGGFQSNEGVTYAIMVRISRQESCNGRRDGGRTVETVAPFNITVCGLDELTAHCETGASHVLSILDPDHPVTEAFGRFGEHAKLELRFHDVIEADRGMDPPREADVARLLAFGHGLIREPSQGAHLVVHCHAGISRSTASLALILAQALPNLSGHNIGYDR